ncbi:two-component sensor histidine kinase [Pseudodesulfovibrio cashew]|uniref:histidine kinase n=1 Tax=Pseudodesulfovibrio cashew TaxID=2678688 RepID=A0A6I6JJR1_9BACT|nr:sensor histidine kinase [Pseudodesulfovibrio cashew]QGY40367.1 two-component sensor histidine kinase [Pseudodesulfovibrio cashew]
MPPEKKAYDKLTRNIALSVITVSIAPLIMVGGLIFDQFRSIYHEKVYAHLAEVVDKHAVNIDDFLREKLYETQYLAGVHTYGELVEPGVMERVLRSMQSQFGRIFVDLGVVDSTGHQVAYAGPYALLGADYSQATWYLDSRSGTASISDVFEGLRQSPHFIIAANSGEADHPWTLRATIDFLAFSNMVENIRMGETGYAYILNEDGVFQTRPPQNRVKDMALEPGRIVRFKGAPSGVTIRESKGDDGETYLTVSSLLKNGQWKLIYRQAESDAFSDMVHAEYVTLAIFLLGGLAIVVMAVLISRKLVARWRSLDRESELINKQMVETGKLAAIGELAAGIAHEINNPVAIMIEEAGWAGDLLADEGRELRSAEEIDRALRQVRTQGKRCKDITHKLLSFARQTDSRANPVHLPDLIREIVGLSEQQARFAHVDFTLDLPESMPLVNGSATELQQVFLNLINNAMQAMELSGGELSVACREEHGQAVIEVRDTGPGIPAANLSRIFEPFFTTKPVGKGSGLGLSICYGIIHRMGGDIDVDSVVGSGTRFTVRLPFPPPGHFQESKKEIRHD